MTFCDYYAELSGTSKDIIDKLDILDHLSAEERQAFDSKTLSKLEETTITEVYNILVVDTQGLTNVMHKWPSNPLDTPEWDILEWWLVDDLKYSLEIGYKVAPWESSPTYQNVLTYKNRLEYLKENIESMGYSFLDSASES